jgi:hypothetical protein
MKATRSFVLALSALATLARSASADEARGLIARVDLGQKRLVLEGRGRARGQELTLTLDARTQVLFRNEAGTLADLAGAAAGRRARVLFEDRDGRPVARVIRVLGPRPETPATPAPAAPGDAGTITGTLRRVAVTGREIVVVGPGPKGPEAETAVAVPEGTPIARGGKAVALEDLREGEAVTVRTEKRDGRLTARSVEAGAVASAAQKRSDLIPRLRLALQLADQILRQMERSRPPQ